MRYFVVVGGADEGPFTFDQLKDLASRGDLRPDSVLRPEGGGEAVSAGTVGGLFATPPPTVQPGPSYAMSPPPPSQGAPSSSRNPVVIALIVLACLCVLCLPISAAILFPVFSQARIAAKRTISLSHMKQMTLAAAMYAATSDDHLPPVMDSGTAVRPYLLPYVNGSEAEKELVFTSGNDRSHEWRGNAPLAGQETFSIKQPNLTMLFWDSQDWPGGKRIVGFADSSARVLESQAVVGAAKGDGVVSPLDITGTKK